MRSIFCKSILLLLVVIGGWSFKAYSQPTDSTKESDMDTFCRYFIKAICTKDTTAFLHSIEKDSLYRYISEKAPDGKKLGSDDLFFPFFFIYGPWVIRSQALAALRQKKDFFDAFEPTIVRKYDDSKIKVSVKWHEAGDTPGLQRIVLLLGKFGATWKVIGADW
jgi:hypothetical protein